MRKATCNNANCVIYGQLADIRMSEIARRRAEDAVRDAHTIVDAVMWATKRMTLLGARIPKLGYEE
jgi:hypothetical protein